MTRKFDGFAPAGDLVTTDIIVGLRGDTNSKFTVGNLFVKGNLPVSNLTSISGDQLLSNRLYVGTLGLPSPAVGTMPIAPAAGDVLVIEAVGAAGVIVNKGTASQIFIGTSAVTTAFLLPQNSSIVLRCFSSALGGQWLAESIVNSVEVDGVEYQNAIGNVQLNKANNLSDVASVTASRANLQAQRLTTVGAVDPTAVAGGVGDGYLNALTGAWFICSVAGSPGTWVRSTSSTAGLLQIVNNLSDVANIAIARANLGAQKLTVIGAVDPTSVAGTAGDSYFNTASKAWFICTVTGSPGTWVSAVSPGALLASNNLSDVANSATARANLGAQKITILGVVNPTSVAGTAGDSYFNTATQAWFICTVTGSPGTWVQPPAASLSTPTSPVLVNTTSPSAAQVLTATSATNATWQTPFSFTVVNANRAGAPAITAPVASGLNILVFTNATINTGGIYNAGTGIFTVPAGKAGRWRISYNILNTSTATANNRNYNLDAALYLNGLFSGEDYSTCKTPLQNTEVAAFTIVSESILNLAVGDQVTIRYINNGNTSITINQVKLVIQWEST